MPVFTVHITAFEKAKTVSPLKKSRDLLPEKKLFRQYLRDHIHILNIELELACIGG